MLVVLVRVFIKVLLLHDNSLLVYRFTRAFSCASISLILSLSDLHQFEL